MQTTTIKATIKRLAIEAHRWFEEALLDKVVGRDDNGGRGGQGKGRASVITNAQRRLLLMFHRCSPTRNPTCVLLATRCCQYWESISKETYISSYVTWTKVTAHPAIGLFSDYIREGARIAQRKEKRESRRKTFQRRKSRLSIFQKVVNNPCLSYLETPPARSIASRLPFTIYRRDRGIRDS